MTAPTTPPAGALLRALEVPRAILALVAGDAAARRAVGFVYAVATLLAYTFQEQHRRAVLGLLWLLITPAMFLAVYLPLFSSVVAPHASAQLGGPYGFSLYVAIGLVTWTAFVEGLQGGAASLVSNPALVQHSPIPLSVLPTVKVVASLVGLTVGAAIIVCLLTALGRWPGTRLLLFPAALGLFGLFTLGLAMLCAAVAIAFRDLLQVLSTLLLIEFFAVPVVYLPESLDARVQALVHANPVTVFLHLVRASLLPQLTLDGTDVAVAAAWAIGAYAVGALVFRRMAGSFADYA